MALTKITSDVIGTGAVTSDHLASGAVTHSSLSSITTDNVSEGSTNTYFTNARARGSVSVTGGGLSYDSGTGVIQIGSIPNTSLTNSSLTVNSNSVSLGGSVTLDTDDIGEGSSNLYFTNARAQGAISGGTGVTVSSGEISIGQDVATSSTPTFGNITTTGYIAGPATFTIDPAAVGDNTGTVVIAGNLQVDGTTTTINSTTLTVDDLNITLASGAANAAAANGAGITVDGASATITYDGTNNRWDFNKSIEIGSGYGGTPNTDSQLIINDSGNNYITIGSGASSEGGILFADSSDNDVGVISYNHSTDILGITAPNGIQFNDKLHIVAGDPITNQTLIEFLNSSGYGIYARTNSIGSRGNTLEFIASDYNNNSATTHSVLALRPEGNVGIGTSSPSLENGGGLVVYNATVPRISLKNSTTGTTGLDGVDIAMVSSDAYFFNRESGAVILGTNGSEKMRIDSSGNVGIGTDDIGTNSKLDVFGGAVQIINDAASFESSTADASLHIKGAEPTQDRLTQMSAIGTSKKALNLIASTASDDSDQWWSWGVDTDDEYKILNGTDFSDSNVGIRIDSNGTITQTTASASPVSANFVTGNSNCDITMNSANTSSLTRLRNGTNDFQVHTNGSERMRIDSSGNVGIGTTPTTPLKLLHLQRTTPTSVGTPDADTMILLDHDGDQYIEFRTSGAETGTMQGNLFTDNGVVGFIGYKQYTAVGVNGNYGESIHIGLRDFSGSDQYSGIYLGNTAADVADGVNSPHMFIKSGGNVGIGTVTPDYTIDVNSGTDIVVGRFQSSLGGSGNRAIMQLKASGNASNGLQLTTCGSTSSVEGGANVVSIMNTENTAMRLGTNNTEAIVIDSSQNVNLKRLAINSAGSATTFIPYGSGLDRVDLMVRSYASGEKHGQVIACDNNGEAHLYMVDTANTSGSASVSSASGGWGVDLYYDGLGNYPYNLRTGQTGTWTHREKISFTGTREFMNSDLQHNDAGKSVQWTWFTTPAHWYSATTNTVTTNFDVSSGWTNLNGNTLPGNVKAIYVTYYYHISGYGIGSGGQGDHASDLWGPVTPSNTTSWSFTTSGNQQWGSAFFMHDGDSSESGDMLYFGAWYPGAIIAVNANNDIYGRLSHGYSGGTHYHHMYCWGYAT